MVFFHAHPDDEAIATGGTMARAAAEGHRVILVTATGGELGERPADVASEEELRILRARETAAACEALGIPPGRFLGYRDSGMAGDEANTHADCFARADVDEAAGRLARILEEEGAEVLTIYDDHGGYGHPDHIQVHRVGKRAAELAGTPRVFESTADRDQMRTLFQRMLDSGVDGIDSPGELDLDSFGEPAEAITTRIDVSGFLEQKRAAMAAHRSQIEETSFFLALPPDLFRDMWSVECLIRHGAEPGAGETWLLD